MNQQVTDLNGRGGMIRTFDPLLPKHSLRDLESQVSFDKSIDNNTPSRLKKRQYKAHSSLIRGLLRHIYDTMDPAEAIALLGAAISIAFAVYWYGGFQT